MILTCSGIKKVYPDFYPYFDDFEIRKSFIVDRIHIKPTQIYFVLVVAFGQQCHIIIFSMNKSYLGFHVKLFFVVVNIRVLLHPLPPPKTNEVKKSGYYSIRNTGFSVGRLVYRVLPGQSLLCTFVAETNLLRHRST